MSNSIVRRDSACAADAAAYAVAAADADAARPIWLISVAILDAATLIGRQAEPIETALVIERAEAAKRRVIA